MKVGDVVGDIDPMLIQRHMIRRTIREHLDKELRLNTQQIKVLTLFFIDKVDFYRQFTEEGQREPGEYARIFEKEYLKPSKVLPIKICFLLIQNMLKMFMMVISPLIKKVHGLKQAKAIMQAAKMRNVVIISS
jgi:hypothetical protein